MPINSIFLPAEIIECTAAEIDDYEYLSTLKLNDLFVFIHPKDFLFDGFVLLNMIKNMNVVEESKYSDICTCRYIYHIDDSALDTDVSYWGACYRTKLLKQVAADVHNEELLQYYYTVIGNAVHNNAISYYRHDIEPENYTTFVERINNFEVAAQRIKEYPHYNFTTYKQYAESVMRYIYYYQPAYENEATFLDVATHYYKYVYGRCHGIDLGPMDRGDNKMEYLDFITMLKERSRGRKTRRNN